MCGRLRQRGASLLESQPYDFRLEHALESRPQPAQSGSINIAKGIDMSLEGGCRCGAVTYQLSLDALPQTYACHCLDCQTWSGSAFGLHALLPENIIELSGPVATYAHRNAQGVTFEERLCPICHTRIYNSNDAASGLLFLRAGTLQESHVLEPMMHIWTKRKQPWIAVPNHIACFEESPTPADYAEVAAR
jgi:hypothetical protein